MRIKTLAVAAGLSAPLILAGSASAEFVRAFMAAKGNPFPVWTVNIYAVFDRPDPGDGSGDHMISVSGTPDAPLNIEVVDGTFYQSLFGGDQAPNGAFFPAFPSLAYETFVTIGVKCFGDPPCQPVDNLTLSPNWPGFGRSTLSLTNGGWSVTPDDPQGDPFDPVNSFPGDGRILIGQFASMDGQGIGDTDNFSMVLRYVSNGIVKCVKCIAPDGAIECLPPSPCINDPGSCIFHADCDDGDPGNGIEVCVDGECEVLCPSDLDNDGMVGITDFLFLLSVWGTPDADLDGDGDTGITDFLLLLSDWGVCP